VIVSGLATILARNPVHSVLWLILAFFNAAGLMVLVGAEFIAMLLVIVYVGAVAVLFLFVVMMLDIDFATLRAGFVQNAPLGLLIALVLVAELLIGTGAVHPALWCWAWPTGRGHPAGSVEHRRHRRAALFALHLPVRSCGCDPAGLHDRRDRAHSPSVVTCAPEHLEAGRPPSRGRDCQPQARQRAGR
jgi:NADH-quinone oxidoreductase subunit J